MVLVSWGKQEMGFGEHWSIQRLTVRVQRKIAGRKLWENDKEDFEWESCSYIEEDLQSAIERWWGGKVIDTFHPLMGRAGQPDRIPFIA